ncbi:MAG: transglycosylase SLT domain-containing protein [Acidobacteria bacterium]|nr:transglycosylase SLT domain-containing protein [Acidobacteriota bacterium]
MTRAIRMLSVALAFVVCAGDGAHAQRAAAAGESAAISTTNHLPLPGHPSLYWLVPDAALSRASVPPSTESPSARFARGVRLIQEGDFAAALPLVQGADLDSTPLAHYRRYYTGVALLGLQRFEEAEAVFDAIDDRVEGHLEEAAPLRLAEAALGRGDARAAADVLNDLSDETLTAPEEVFLRLGAAYEAAGDPARALRAYYRVYYEFPLTTQAIAAQEAIERLQTPGLVPPDRFRLELGRAERLFDAGRWAQARPAYAELAAAATGDERELVAIRLAACDYQLGRHRASRDGLRPYLKSASREAEVRFWYLSATRGLGDHAGYVALVRELVADHPESRWAEEALNDLASHYIRLEDEDAADQVLRELMRRFPRGRHTDRAAWKVGWRAYRQGQYGDASRTFELAAATFPRADYRPSWLYWAARSRDRLHEPAAATALYRVVAADYLNSYYGRLASAILADRKAAPVHPIVRTDPGAAPAPLVPTDAVVRALVALELHDAALDEVEYARKAWGDSAALQATAAWIRHRRGLQPGAADRFADVRGAITLMRRAYPQFMAAGGERLPADILRVIFPLDYWPLIRKYSEAHRLDPYLMTALIAQESTFTADVRSPANAVGLMQLIPATGRRYAGKLGIRFSTRALTQPETNIRLGMRYFRDLMDRFGASHYALAGYNAGERRVARWIAERPGLAQDEFIDDIPFLETQNYVKRILGTADDYRRLYGGGILTTTTATR